MNWERSQNYSLKSKYLAQGLHVSDLTLEDVAKKADVSRSTVSRVVNEHPNVSVDVRKRVQDVIKNTGYHPHAAARALASQRSWMIGLVLPRSVSSFFTDPYFPHLTQGIAYACNQNHYTLSLFLVGTKEDEEQIVPRISRRGLLDGIIFQSGQMGDKLIDRLTSANIPLVVAGRPFRAEGISYIDVDNIQASKIAVEHLIHLGYKRIGAITGPRTVGIDRKEGYLRALSEHGIKVDQSLIIEGDFTEASGYEVMKKLLKAKPDAVFAASDIIAIGAIRAVKEAGLRVPEDIAFVGFDDLPFTSLTDYHLTTVRQPVYQFGVKAVEMLIDLIENGTEPTRHVTLGTEFVVRDTCGASRRK